MLKERLTNMKKCQHCNLVHEDIKKFCYKCGNPLMSTAEAVSQKPQETPSALGATTKEQKSRNMKLVIAISSVILILIVSIVGLNASDSVSISKNGSEYTVKKVGHHEKLIYEGPFASVYRMDNNKNLVKEESGIYHISELYIMAPNGELAKLDSIQIIIDEANNKAKASEFPTMLAAIRVAEGAYMAQTGRYATTFKDLNDSVGVDLSIQSKWFSYSIDNVTQNTYTAHAVVIKKFGQVTVGEEATINQNNEKTISKNLILYVPNWR